MLRFTAQVVKDERALFRRVPTPMLQTCFHSCSSVPYLGLTPLGYGYFHILSSIDLTWVSAEAAQSYRSDRLSRLIMRSTAHDMDIVPIPSDTVQ